MFKKATVVGLAVILAAVVVASAAYRVSTREYSLTSTTEVPSAATTKAKSTTKAPVTITNVTTIRVWDDPLQTRELKLLFETHKKTMLELAGLLFEQNVKSLNISSGYYEGDSIDEELKKEVDAFLQLVEAETDSDAQIGVGVVNDKRLFVLGITAYYGEALIRYMPDGYIAYTHPMPEMTKVVLRSESKLAKNWYGYWW
jgi:hypothetical protein